MPLEDDPNLPGAVSKTAMELVNGFVAREFENIVQMVLLPLEDKVVETVRAQVGSEMDLKAMQRTLNAKGEGSLVDSVVEVAQKAVGCMEENFVSGLEAALLEDAPGEGGSTAVRVGRFAQFVNAVVSKAKEEVHKKVNALKDDLEECCKTTICKLSSPRYNLKARTGSIVMEGKPLADAITHTIIGVAVEPLIGECLVETAASECLVWTESCGEERSKLKNDLARVERIMGLDIFQDAEGCRKGRRGTAKNNAKVGRRSRGEAADGRGTAQRSGNEGRGNIVRRCQRSRGTGAVGARSGPACVAGSWGKPRGRVGVKAAEVL